jgi:myo-inositol-1(or 4)-monophosphatase
MTPEGHRGHAAPPGEEMDLVDAIAAMAERLMRRGLRGGRAALGVASKSDPTDLVTRVDREVERRARAMVAAAFPDHAFLGEEEGGRPAPAGTTWVVDPVDGTANYANGLPHACVAVGLCRGRRPVAGLIADPFRRERFRVAPGGRPTCNGRPLAVKAGEGIAGGVVLLELGSDPPPALLGLFARVRAAGAVCRVLGSAALSLAYVAAGRADAAVLRRASAWDVAAGLALVEAAGGTVSTWDGGPYDPFGGGPLLAGHAAACHLLGPWLRAAAT